MSTVPVATSILPVATNDAPVVVTPAPVVTPATPKPSFLKRLGTDFVKAFNWFGSPKGQAVITSAEAITLAVDPALAPIVNIVNVWSQSIWATEKKAATAASLGAAATNTQKAAAAIEAVLPDVLADMKKANLQFATSGSAQVINDAIVAIMNQLVPAPTATTPTAG